MLNSSASLAISTYILEALSGKLGIKRHSPSILYLLHLFIQKYLRLSDKYHLLMGMSICCQKRGGLVCRNMQLFIIIALIIVFIRLPNSKQFYAQHMSSLIRAFVSRLNILRTLSY